MTRARQQSQQGEAARGVRPHLHVLLEEGLELLRAAHQLLQHGGGRQAQLFPDRSAHVFHHWPPT